MNEWLGVRTENLVCVSDAMNLLDYSLEEMMQENILMMNMSQGGLTYKDLCSMSFKEHQIYYKELYRGYRKLEKSDEGEVNG